METAIESFQKGYEAMGAVREDMASKDILSQVYSGQTPEEIKDPIKQAATLTQAAGMLQSKGLASAAYKLQKQAGALSTDVNKQTLDDLKVKQGMLEYSGQLLTTATNDEDLNNAFSNIKDTSAQMNIQRVIKMNVPFEKKKQMLEDMTKSVDQHLKAQQIEATASNRLSVEKNRADDNIRADRSAALARINASAGFGKPPLYEDVVLAYGKDYADALMGGKTPDASSTGRGTAESGNDYSAVNPKSGAMGRYQITKPTLESLRKIDPSLPKTDAEFLKDPAAQDKAMKLLEVEDKKSLKADGFKDSKVNLATYHRFGAPDGKKVLSAFEDNPATPLKEALGESRYNTIVDQNPDLKDKTVGQAIVQNYGTGSKAATGKPGEMPVLKKQGTGLPAERAGNILEATLQASKDLINVTKLPEATTLNTFAGLSGKDAKGIVSGLEGAFSRQVTTGDQRAFEQLIAGLESTMATAVGGGFASAASKAKMEQYAKQIPRAGDNAESAAIFLARMKQELQTVREGFVDRQGANSEQVKKMDQAMADLDKAIPFTIDQVMEAKAKRAGGKTMGAKATSTYGSGAKKSAEDEAKAAGF